MTKHILPLALFFLFESLCFARAPFNGDAFGIPATIEFEHFDNAKPAANSTYDITMGYYDTDVSNSGGKFRDTQVDIVRCDDLGGGYCLTNCITGEWLNYSVFVPTPGNYKVSMRVKGSCGIDFGFIADGESS